MPFMLFFRVTTFLLAVLARGLLAAPQNGSRTGRTRAVT